MTKKIKTVFFIDDDVMSNMNNKRVMEKANLAAEVVTAGSAVEALELLKQKFLLPEKFPELIFLDIYMPELSGWDFIERFKQFRGQKGKSKIVLLSASPDETDLARAKKIPEVSGYAVKPLTEKYIAQLTQELFPQL